MFFCKCFGGVFNYLQDKSEWRYLRSWWFRIAAILKFVVSLCRTDLGRLTGCGLRGSPLIRGRTAGHSTIYRASSGVCCEEKQKTSSLIFFTRCSKKRIPLCQVQWLSSFNRFGEKWDSEGWNNRNSIQEEITSRLKSGNACYHSVQNLLSSGLLSKNIKFQVYRTIVQPVVLYGCEPW